MVHVCCVPKCSNKIRTKRTFPLNYPEVFKIWLQRIGNEKLLALEPEKVYKNYRVCDKHFSVFCRIPNENKLKFGSLPTLLLAGFNEVATEQNSLYNFTFGGVVAQEKLVTKDVDLEEAGPSGLQRIVSNEEVVSTEEQPIAGPSFLQESPLQSALQSPVHWTTTRKKRKNLLKMVNVTRINQLTPKARRYYKELKKLGKVRRKLYESKARTKESLEEAYDWVQVPEVTTAINNITKKFIVSQIKLQKKSPRGRRFTEDDKILALSIMRHSGKAYKLLQRIFALPSRRTLNNLLSEVPFYPGINSYIFEHLKTTAEQISPMDRYCALLFDEMSLSCAVHYNSKTDEIVGFENDGTTRTNKFADHVLVCMLRGLRKKWKQPVAYAFVENSTSAVALKNLIKNVIVAAEDIGLHIVATVCDQGSNNRAAIKALLQDTNEFLARQGKENVYFGFRVNNKEIIPLYDPPHLLKGIRNNFIVKDVNFSIKNKTYKASWEDIILLYKLNEIYDDKKICPKLTEQHVYLEKMPKMKVSIAAQALSQRVSAIMNFAADCGKLPQSAYGTAEFIFFIDQLFDSINGTSLYSRGKPLKVCVTDTSPHMPFWSDAIKVLSSTKFVSKDKSNKKPMQPPTIPNWIWTLRGFKCLYLKLKKEGFSFLSPRQINQDPLENFFGCVRSQGARNINPSSTSFINSFKTLLINNFMSPQLLSLNCENDESDGALNTLRCFIKSTSTKINHASIETVTFKELGIPPYVDSVDFMEKNLNNYIAGFVAKQLLLKFKCCGKCKKTLIADDHPDTHYYKLISKRRYGPRALHCPSIFFGKIFCKAYYYCSRIIPFVCHLNNVKSIIINMLTDLIPDINNCDEHDLKVAIIKTTTEFYIAVWVKEVNKILKGRSTKRVYNDFMKNNAVRKFDKSRKRKV